MTRDDGRRVAHARFLVALLAIALLLGGGRGRAADAACLPLPTPLPPGQADQRFWDPELIAEVAARGPAPDFGTSIPTDQPTLQAVRHCQLASGLAYPHGIYFGPLNRFFAAIEQGDLPVGGRVIRSDGAP